MIIWKWSLRITDSQTIQAPKGAEILASQIQGEALSLWALCDPSAEIEERVIGIYGTGNPIPPNPGTFVGTFQLADGGLVFHVFDGGSA